MKQFGADLGVALIVALLACLPLVVYAWGWVR